MRRVLEPAAPGRANAVLCSLIDGMSGPTTWARIWRGLTQERAVERTREQRLAILDAIAARRPEVARSWSLIHVAGVEEWLRRAPLTPHPARLRAGPVGRLSG
ncbi:hypothetical protein CS0771_29680 [Catellatospora sp. IY07-71]|uniref:hypothetical protein n=1 Tax=Catellatospora sp. IY07-71 TaxID=2728827 RepID=UPI001BB43414|nr:hypothetical protein [Catellatospora sp. IY07-71]BCJ73424.1 hypothetical protein CS0771_29680 [Catellatospora sp. IY07-71]